MKKLMMTLVLMPMMVLATGNLYMVIDLSGGPSATSYPVSYLDNVPTGGWTDEYKTTKLVMRRIPAGTFMMGDGKDSYLKEVTGKVQGSVPVHSVSLTKDFYIGVFEVTQRQWELVMGSNPSYFSGHLDSSRRPVETVSYNMIRGETLGAEWPQSSNVDDGSFLAVIRSKAKLDNLDLPTSAQWEYACRAGTSTDLNTGVNLTDASTDSKLDGVGWYSGNSSGSTHEVGLCTANNWGLYDMHGNVWEWCLDWYDYATGESEIDPVGPATRRNWGDASRVFRGGSHNNRSGQCRSANEADYGCYRVDHLWGDFGFRLAMTVTGGTVVVGTTWYVNGSSGADYNSGTSASSAKATIQAAIDASAEGDTILVAPGTYAPITTENKAITIRSTAGAASTIIDGQSSKVCVSAGQYNDDRAPVAICTNTIVVGFTLQNGNGKDFQTEPGNGGCASCGTYKNCIIVNGKSAGGGCGAWAIFEDCLIKGGRAINGGNVIGSIVRNCTMVDGYANDNGGAYYNCAVYNSICYNNDSGWRWGSDNGTSYTTSSYYWGDSDPYKEVGCEQVNVYKGNPGFVDAANGDYRLAAGSPCIDAGDNAYVTGDTDLAGNARIANGKVDIGCYEYNGTLPPPVVTYTVTFNLNGADGAAPAGRSVTHGAAVGELPNVTRSGYTFLGWFTAASGGVQVSAATKVTANATYYAQWRINSYTVTFNANGGSLGSASATRSVTHGAAVGALPTATRSGYTFLGWFTAASGGTQVSASTTVMANATYYAQWRINSYTVTFNANGGSLGSASATRSVTHGAAVGTLPTATRTGYTFLGWFTAASGGAQVSAATTVTANTTYYVHWQQNVTPTPPPVVVTYYTVTFDANGGSLGSASATRSVAEGAAVGALPMPEAEGYEFVGWFTAANGGSQVSTSTKVTANVTYYAHWQAVEDYNTLWDEDEAFDADAAATFDGFLVKDGEVKGLVQVKAAKANKKTGVAKLTANVTLLGQSAKISYKGVFGKPSDDDDFSPGLATLTSKGHPDLELRIGRNALWGVMGDYDIEGSRNVFAKAGDPNAGVLSRWLGTYTLALETVDAEGRGEMLAWGYSGLSVTISAKGKVKVQGTMVDGAKVSVSSQLLVGDGRCCIPIVVPLYTKKGGFGFNLWLHDDGTVEAGELSAWDATASKTPFMAWFGEEIVMAKSGAALPETLAFMFMGEPELGELEVLYDCLPWEVEFSAGSRWKLPAAGAIKYDKEAEEWYDSKDSDNPSGLKLTYVSKTGAFKGTFKIYAVNASGTLKKFTANVSGVMVGGKGYGTATVKNVGCWPIAIE